MAQLSVAQEGPWYSGLTRTQWKTLAASNLGWLFDGYETYALIITVAVALHQLLDPSLYPQIPAYAGTVIGITLFGWGTGGIIAGVLADYIGRRRMMMIAILSYSVLTGLSAFAWNWESFAALRFLVGLAIGTEWVTGSSMTAEIWPDRARGRGAGLMHCGLGIGFFIASLVWLYVSGFGPDAWRYMYFIGVLPALFTLWVRRNIPESPLWQESNARRRAATAQRQSGASLTAADAALARFTLHDLFADRAVRPRLIAALLMSFTTTLAWWGISSWVPPYVASLAAKAGLPAQAWASYAGMAYNLGAIAGYVSLGFLSDAFGRKPVVWLYFGIAFLSTPLLFLWTSDLSVILYVTALNGFFSLGLYAWMPVWLPELFPTRMRATGMAFCFNAPRLVACFGPAVAGLVIASLGGFGRAATTVAFIYILGLAATPFLPETRGTKLPETL
ncbi:MAG TPA: MFS transporter [Candidatus Sulfotelmatobacter sp.]|nr:MFS transporter [Candidatus Sulfotelmatobacter sp.]